MRPGSSGRLADRAILYLDQSRKDLQESRQLLRQEDYLNSAFHAVQAGVNGLTSICLGAGMAQLPGASPGRLFLLCVEIDPQYQALHEICDLMEQVTGVDPFQQQGGDLINRTTSTRLIDGAGQVVVMAQAALGVQSRWKALGRLIRGKGSP